MTALLLMVLLGSELPDPAAPSFVALAGTLGFFVGGLVAYVRRIPPEERSRWMGTGTWAGIGVGGGIWILMVTIDRL